MFSFILHGHIWNTAVILRDASPLAYVLIAGVVAAECPSAEAFAEIFRLAARMPSASTAETLVDMQLIMCTPVEIEMTESSLISQRLSVFLVHLLWHRRLNSLGQKVSAARWLEDSMCSRAATGVRGNNQSVSTRSYISYMERYKEDSDIPDRTQYTTRPVVQHMQIVHF